MEDRVRAIMRFFGEYPDYHGFDSSSLKETTFISADNAAQSVEFEVNIAPELCNKMGNLHGGAAATILDMLTSTALAHVSRPGFIDQGHVSRTLSCSYLRPVPMHSRVRVSARVAAAGRNTANLTGEIKSMDGKILVGCVHDKSVFSSSRPKSKM